MGFISLCYICYPVKHLSVLKIVIKKATLRRFFSVVKI
ncbi:hypothetical protein PALB_12010 [Pseudoalteromonas luteoviolacea B = ATCC 29581]|nr:hypothetical protein PALB_12010 [Pseudoalteromonas luteoviolacea B = ATCC 29581]